MGEPIPRAVRDEVLGIVVRGEVRVDQASLHRMIFGLRRGRRQPAESEVVSVLRRGQVDCLKRRLRIRYSSTIVFLPPPRGQHRPKQVRSSFCPRRQEAARPHAKGAPRRAPDSCALCGRHLIIAADICTQAFRRWASNVGVASWLVTLLAFPSSTPAPAPRPRIHLTR